MAKKKRGYVELYWTCPNCEGENLGSVSTCGNCGKPQPKDVDFHQGSHQQLIKDEQKLKRAKAGADIHCAFCGTRNPAGTKHCSQCGSDLSVGLHRDSAGRIVGAFKEGMGAPIECSNCGTLNPYKNRKCQNCGTSLSHKGEKKKKPSTKQKTGKEASAPQSKTFVIGGIVLLALCALLYFVFLRSNELTGEVTGVEWQRSIAVESFEEVEGEDWFDEISADAEILSCQEEIRFVQNEAPIDARADEVCGTPYNVETGGGFAEVVQDCEYHVYDDLCSYITLDWVEVSTLELDGNNFSPQWPSAALASDTRMGEQSESYTCIFDVDGENYRYVSNSVQEFQECAIGSTWTLTVNSFGSVDSIDH